MVLALVGVSAGLALFLVRHRTGSAESDALREQARRLVAEHELFANPEFDLDVDAIRFERLDRDEIAERIASKIDAPSASLVAALERCLGAPAPDDDAGYVQMRARQIADWLDGVYWPDEQTIAFPRTIDPSTEKPTPISDRTFLHELAHVIDARRFPPRKPATIDLEWVDRCRREGFADLVADLAIAHRAGRTPNFHFDSVWRVDTRAVIGGDARLPYMLGARAEIMSFERSFPGFTPFYWEEPEYGWSTENAPSTEQILHLEKWSDTPTRIDLPDDAGDTALETTVGELGIYFLLRTMREDGLGRTHRSAYMAASGWDGDRVRLEHHGDGDDVILWRVVFDRVRDANEFAHFAGVGDWTITKRDAVVDLAWGSTPSLHADAERRLADHPIDYAPDEEDARTASLAPDDPPWRRPLVLEERQGVASGSMARALAGRPRDTGHRRLELRPRHRQRRAPSRRERSRRAGAHRDTRRVRGVVVRPAGRAPAGVRRRRRIGDPHRRRGDGKAGGDRPLARRGLGGDTTSRSCSVTSTGW